MACSALQATNVNGSTKTHADGVDGKRNHTDPQSNDGHTVSHEDQADVSLLSAEASMVQMVSLEPQRLSDIADTFIAVADACGVHVRGCRTAPAICVRHAAHCCCCELGPFSGLIQGKVVCMGAMKEIQMQM